MQIMFAVLYDDKGNGYNMKASEGSVEIYAWKTSTLTPYFTHRFSLDDTNTPLDGQLPVTYELNNALLQVRVSV